MSKRYEFKFTDEQRKEMSEIFMKEFMKRIRIDAYHRLIDQHGYKFMDKSSIGNVDDRDNKFISAWNKAFIKHAILLKQSQRWVDDLQIDLRDMVNDCIYHPRRDMNYYFTKASCENAVKRMEKEVMSFDYMTKKEFEEKELNDMIEKLAVMGYDAVITKRS